MRAVMLKLVTGALCFSPIATQAQTPPSEGAAKPATALDTRIAQLPTFLAGKMAASDLFAPAFLASISEAQLKALSEQLIAQYGQPLSIISVVPNGPTGATTRIDFEKGIATVDIVFDATAPNKIVGLLIKSVEMKGDSRAKIDADFAKLPGATGYLVEKVSQNGQRTQIAARNPAQSFAIASTFKLYVLAELASQVEAGQRKWSDVVQLTNNNYSSPSTQRWPRDTPVTLQTLATWMISVSDNAATDALIRVLGRDAVEQKLATIGHSSPDQMLPLLTTTEAFALKSNPLLRVRFEKASEAQQRDILIKEAESLGFDRVDVTQFGASPMAINSIEWFAAPADIALLMNHLRQIGSKTALDIMAVNTGLPGDTANKWQYFGYKGGSEPGVISMSFMAQSKTGEWYTITGSWNNSKATVDDAVFVALMGRLVANVAEGGA